MDLQGCRPRSISLGSPFQDKRIYDNHYHDLSTQTYLACDDVVLQQYDFSKIHPRNHDAALTATLNQLDHFMESRNICRYFMLRTCSAQKCDRVHDAIFRETFMGSLFGDAWCGFGNGWNGSHQDLSSRHPLKDNTATGIKVERTSETPKSSPAESQCKLDIISFEPPKTLNVAAGLCIPLSSPATPVYAALSTEMEDDKSEFQADAGLGDVRQQHSVADSRSRLRPHAIRRRLEGLYAFRDWMDFRGKATSRKTTTKQKGNPNESETALGHAD